MLQVHAACVCARGHLAVGGPLPKGAVVGHFRGKHPVFPLERVHRPTYRTKRSKMLAKRIFSCGHKIIFTCSPEHGLHVKMNLRHVLAE